MSRAAESGTGAVLKRNSQRVDFLSRITHRRDGELLFLLSQGEKVVNLFPNDPRSMAAGTVVQFMQIPPAPARHYIGHPIFLESLIGVSVPTEHENHVIVEEWQPVRFYRLVIVMSRAAEGRMMEYDNGGHIDALHLRFQIGELSR